MKEIPHPEEDAACVDLHDEGARVDDAGHPKARAAGRAMAEKALAFDTGYSD